MAIARKTGSARQVRREESVGEHARSGKREHLLGSYELIVAAVAARFSTVGHSSLLLLALSARRHVEEDSRRPPREGPQEGRTQADAFGRDS